MKIKLSYVGYLKLDGVKSGDLVYVEDGSTVADVMTQFSIPKHQQRFITPFVNDEESKLGQELKDQDELTLVIQVGGGL